MGSQPERENPSISGAPAQKFTRNPNNAKTDGGGNSSFVCQKKSPESHQNPPSSFSSLMTNELAGHLAWQTWAGLSLGAGPRAGEGKMPLTAINFQPRRRGTKQSSAPLRCLFQFILCLNARRCLPTCFFKLIIGSGKLAYLRLALRMTEESHKHKQTGEMLCGKRGEKKKVAAFKPVGGGSCSKTVFLFFKTD